MVIKMLPGLGITLVLGVLFCYGEAWLTGEEIPAPATARVAVPLFEPAPAAETIAEPTAFTPQPPKPDQPPLFENGVLRLPVPAAPTEPSADLFLLTPPAPGQTPSKNEVRLPLPLPISKPLAGVASDSAMANMTGESCAAPVRYEPPDKGIYAWAKLGTSQSEQKLTGDRRSFYKQDTTTASAGVLRDWSIDTILGLSVDMVDSEIKGRRDYDDRKNEVSGFVLNGHFSTLVLDKYLVDAKAFYGRLENKGSGMYGSSSWREEKHDADLFGFSGGVRVPWTLWDEYRFDTEMGVSYASLRSDAHLLHWRDALENHRLAKQDTSSLTIPMRLTVSKDFVPCWGWVTPRLSLGLVQELDDSATALRTYNSAAAGMFSADLNAGTGDLFYDGGRQTIFEIGMGVDIRSIGGWNLRADYLRQWAKKYHNDTFSLEFGRCF